MFHSTTRRALLFTIICHCLINGAFAQAPQKFSYQAVIRTNTGQLHTSSAVGCQISILQGGTAGTPVYVETHLGATNANGLLTLEIGTGTIVSGSFSSIQWSNGPYFLKTETDLNGGTSYTLSGATQLLSVPYALHSSTADSLSNGISETDPVFSVSIAAGINASDTANWNNKLDSEVDGSVTNEIQVLSIGNDTLFLSSGGFAILPPEVDGSVTNELQTLSINGDSIFLSSGGSIMLPPDGDDSDTNEIQHISLIGDTLFLSQGDSVVLSHPSFPVTSLDSVLYRGSDAAGDSILNLGTLGIGTISPDSLLDVAGGARIQRLNINSAYTLPTVDGSNGQILTTNGQGHLYWETPSDSTGLTGMGISGIALLKDIKPSGNSGGASSAFTWHHRDLNTLEGDTSFVSLNSNEFTLSAGVYIIEWSAPAYRSNLHKTRLFNISDSIVQTTGSTEQATTQEPHTMRSFGYSMVEITTGKTFRIDHYIQSAQNITGLGRALDIGEDEVFTQVKVIKVDKVFGGGSGSAASNSSDTTGLSDADGDTKIQAEESPDEDIIRFDIAGTEFFRMDSGHFEIVNTGASVFIGDRAGEHDDLINNQNVFIGDQAGRENASGSANTFIGRYAGLFNTSGAGNTFIGANTGEDNTIGNRNTAVGRLAGYKLTTGDDNVMVGFNAGRLTSTGGDNVFIGNSSGHQNVSGERNAFLGYEAGNKNTTGMDNVAIGNDALYYQTEGQYNVALGSGAGFGGSSAHVKDRNVYIGYRAGLNHTGSGSILVGYHAGYNDTTDNKLYIENSNSPTPLIWGDFANDSVRIHGYLEATDGMQITSGSVGIGTNSPTHLLHVNGVARSTSSTWATSSDVRVKQNVQDIPDATDLIAQLHPVTFEWTPGYQSENPGLRPVNYGFISQEVERVIPEMVSETVQVIGTDTIADFKVLDKDPLFALLVKAIQEQQAQIDELYARNRELATQLEAVLNEDEQAATLETADHPLDHVIKDKE